MIDRIYAHIFEMCSHYKPLEQRAYEHFIKPIIIIITIIIIIVVIISSSINDDGYIHVCQKLFLCVCHIIPFNCNYFLMFSCLHALFCAIFCDFIHNSLAPVHAQSPALSRPLFNRLFFSFDLSARLREPKQTEMRHCLLLL